MSRSFRKTPTLGVTTAPFEADNKRLVDSSGVFNKKPISGISSVLKTAGKMRLVCTFTCGPESRHPETGPNRFAAVNILHL